MPKQKIMICVAVGTVFVALCVQLYLTHIKLDSIYSNAATGYDVGGVYGTNEDRPEEPDEDYRQFVWSRFEQGEPSAKGMSGHWVLSCPASMTSHSGFWKETKEPNTFELYSIVDGSRVGSIHLYFSSEYADGRIWLEFNGEHTFLYEMDE